MACVGAHEAYRWAYRADAQLWHPPARDDGTLDEHFVAGHYIKDQPWCPTAEEVAEAERTVPRAAPGLEAFPVT